MTIRSALVCLFLGLSASGCGSGTSGPLSAADFGKKYKFSDNEVPGRTQTPVSDTDQNPYVFYATDPFPGWVDGDPGSCAEVPMDGGDVYTPNGCRVAMFQDLVGPNSATNRAIAMDFVTADKATAMFTYMQQNGYSTSIAGYDGSTALGSSTLGGINVTAHFKASYFEVWLSGFADTTSAGAAAKLFLDVFKSKTN